MHVCGSACALAFLSHMCGACAVSAGLGEEELGDSRAQRRDSDEQAGSRQASSDLAIIGSPPSGGPGTEPLGERTEAAPRAWPGMKAFQVAFTFCGWIVESPLPRHSQIYTPLLIDVFTHFQSDRGYNT